MIIKIEAPEIVSAINALTEVLSRNEMMKLNQINNEQDHQEALTTQSTISLEEIRAKLTSLVDLGKQDEVKKLIAKYGVRKLTEVPQEKYADLINELERLDEKEERVK